MNFPREFPLQSRDHMVLNSVIRDIIKRSMTFRASELKKFAQAVVVCCEREYEPATILVGIIVSCNIKLDSIVYRSRGCEQTVKVLYYA